MKLNVRSLAIACSALALLAAIPGYGAGLKEKAATAWDPQAAARYLDARESEWQAWDRPQKDRGTLCISCHTQATYGLARPVLHRILGDQSQTGAEKAMLASIQKRVGIWEQMQPFYSDIPSGAGKEIESHNTEAVLNAFILSSYDRESGHLGDVARKAFDNAWALQSMDGPDKGSWVWQNFTFAPFESKESQYHWAALMAVAVGRAPGNYRADPAIAKNLDLLTSYLSGHYETQPLLNKLAALWASGSFPAILDAKQRGELVQQLDRLQHSDGGWSLYELGPWGPRADKSPVVTKTDAYATAMIVLVREELGAKRDDKAIARAIQWLSSNQDKATGAWTAWSLNKDRDPASMPGKFMSDAATAYAVMALEESKN